MKKVLVIAALAGLVLAVGAYGARKRISGPSIETQAALYQIERIEKTWHKASSLKNLDLMMSIWAPNATMTIGGSTMTGKAAIREFFTKAAPFQPQNHWISDTPAYKIRAEVHGNRGTLYFECHYIDLDTQKVASVVAADQQVQKINGKWLITNLAVATATLTSPLPPPVGASGARTRTSSPSIQKQAALYQIERIEKTWHKAASSKNLDLMMSIWAPNATYTVAGSTMTGKAAIRAFLAKAGPFQPQNHWISDTPAYKIRAEVHGNRGTLYFECHYIDVDTGTLVTPVGGDWQVQKINGKWLITNVATATVTLQP